MSNRAIVLSVEGLSTASLQPYGCSWQSTPCLNQLAAESLVFDRLIADSVRSSRSLESMWRGGHAACDGSPAAIFGSWRSSLLTDDAEIANAQIADLFTDSMVVHNDRQATRSDEVDQTALSDLLATFIERVSSEPEGLHWCHLTSLARYWDAPLYLCDGNDDLPAFHGTNPPRHPVIDNIDPDEKLAWMSAYGGQVRLLDSLLDVLIRMVDSIFSRSDTLLVLVGTSGFALGENGSFGNAIGPATSPRIHLPLIVRAAEGGSLRSSRICQPGDIGLALQNWLQGEPAGLLLDGTPDGWAASNTPQSWAITLAEDGCLASFLAPKWLLHRTGASSELFRKPDDRFDVNDISVRAPEIVMLLEEHAERGLTSLRSAAERHRLPDELCSGDW